MNGGPVRPCHAHPRPTEGGLETRPYWWMVEFVTVIGVSSWFEICG